MKKTFCIFLSILLFLSGCSTANDQSLVTSEESQEMTHVCVDELVFFSAITDQAFYELIFSNSIDANNDIFCNSTLAQSDIPIYNEYREQWEEQIVQTIQILESELKDSEYQNIIKAQTAWEEFMETTLNLEQSLYYIGGIAGDGTTYPLVSLVRAARTRARAIELMSLEYMLTDEIQFMPVPDEGINSNVKHSKSTDDYFVIVQEKDFFDSVTFKDEALGSAGESDPLDSAKQNDYWSSIEQQTINQLKEYLNATDYDLLVQATTAWKEYMDLTYAIEADMLQYVDAADSFSLELTNSMRNRAEAVTVLSYQYSVESAKSRNSYFKD
jgi:hypothetical protein